jgi:outer membrane protein TolC
VKQAEIALEQNRNTVNLAKQGIDLQIASSRTQFANAYKALQIQEENKQLAERVYNGTKTKYERGLGSSFEVLQSETSLQDALSTYYQSMYNAVVAKISYLRALGQL